MSEAIFVYVPLSNRSYAFIKIYPYMLITLSVDTVSNFSYTD